MSAKDPVESVVDILANGGYSPLPRPVAVAGVPFDFDALLVGGDRAFDLVVVADTVRENNVRLRQRVEALARALDVVGSKRSLTVITVGPPPKRNEVNGMSRVSRVLSVSPRAHRSGEIAEVLSVLLPLRLPTGSSMLADPVESLAVWLSGQRERKALSSVLESAAGGAEEVTKSLVSYLQEPLTTLQKELP